MIDNLIYILILLTVLYILYSNIVNKTYIRILTQLLILFSFLFINQKIIRYKDLLHFNLFNLKVIRKEGFSDGKNYIRIERDVSNKPGLIWYKIEIFDENNKNIFEGKRAEEEGNLNTWTIGSEIKLKTSGTYEENSGVNKSINPTTNFDSINISSIGQSIDNIYVGSKPSVEQSNAFVEFQIPSSLSIKNIKIYRYNNSNLDSYYNNIVVKKLSNSSKFSGSDVLIEEFTANPINGNVLEFKSPSVTQPPTTQAPTTQAPTTQAPTTQAPTTQAPTTQATIVTTSPINNYSKLYLIRAYQRAVFTKPPNGTSFATEDEIRKYASNKQRLNKKIRIEENKYIKFESNGNIITGEIGDEDVLLMFVKAPQDFDGLIKCENENSNNNCWEQDIASLNNSNLVTQPASVMTTAAATTKPTTTRPTTTGATTTRPTTTRPTTTGASTTRPTTTGASTTRPTTTGASTTKPTTTGASTTKPTTTGAPTEEEIKAMVREYERSLKELEKLEDSIPTNLVEEKQKKEKIDRLLRKIDKIGKELEEILYKDEKAKEEQRLKEEERTKFLRKIETVNRSKERQILEAKILGERKSQENQAKEHARRMSRMQKQQYKEEQEANKRRMKAIKEYEEAMERPYLTSGDKEVMYKMSHDIQCNCKPDKLCKPQKRITDFNITDHPDIVHYMLKSLKCPPNKKVDSNVNYSNTSLSNVSLYESANSTNAGSLIPIDGLEFY